MQILTTLILTAAEQVDPWATDLADAFAPLHKPDINTAQLTLKNLDEYAKTVHIS